MLKSSLVRWGMSAPCLSWTVKYRLTRLTLTFRVSNGFDSPSFLVSPAGPWGGASGEGATCAAAFITATQSKTAHNQDTQRGRRKFMKVRRRNMANDTSEVGPRKQDEALQRRQHVW